MYANRAACRWKLNEAEPCAADCTSALTLQPRYAKALLRRAAAYEALDRPEDALADYRAALEVEPRSAPAREGVERLPAVIEARTQRLKVRRRAGRPAAACLTRACAQDEMMGNLKSLGNMCLRPFGLSTDNFQFVQDPKSGGYSVNFKQ